MPENEVLNKIGELQESLKKDRASTDTQIAVINDKLKNTVTPETLQAELTKIVEDQKKNGPLHDRRPDADGAVRKIQWTQPGTGKTFVIGTQLTSMFPDSAKFLRAIIRKDMATLTSMKALSTGTGEDGGFIVPTELLNIFIEKLPKPNHVNSRWTVVPTSLAAGEMPRDGAAVTMFRTGENVSLTESNPKLEQLKFTMNKLTGFSKTSRELVADTMFPIVDWFVRVFTNAMQEKQQDEFINGTGSLEMQGLRFATPAITAIAQAGANLVGDDLITLKFRVPQQYRSGATWKMASEILELVSKLKDTQNRFLFLDSLVPEVPATLLGMPILEIDQIPVNLGGGTDESIIWLGNILWYYYFDKGEMRIETTTEGGTSFQDDQMWLKMVKRDDGKLGLADAYRQLTGVK